MPKGKYTVKIVKNKYNGEHFNELPKAVKEDGLHYAFIKLFGTLRAALRKEKEQLKFDNASDEIKGRANWSREHFERVLRRIGNFFNAAPGWLVLETGASSDEDDSPVLPTKKLKRNVRQIESSDDEELINSQNKPTTSKSAAAENRISIIDLSSPPIKIKMEKMEPGVAVTVAKENLDINNNGAHVEHIEADASEAASTPKINGLLAEPSQAGPSQQRSCPCNFFKGNKLIKMN